MFGKCRCSVVFGLACAMLLIVIVTILNTSWLEVKFLTHNNNNNLFEQAIRQLDDILASQLPTKRALYLNQISAQELFGKIWPASDNDTTDRIATQMDYLQDYSRWKQERGGFKKIKVIYAFGRFNLREVTDGQAVFNSCPVKECVVTWNFSAEKTADAVLITQYGSRYNFKKTLRGPKPAHQIWIAQHREPPVQNRMDEWTSHRCSHRAVGPPRASWSALRRWWRPAARRPTKYARAGRSSRS